MNSCTWIHIFMNSYLHFSNEFIQTINSYDCFLVNSYNNSYIYIYTHIILMNSCINWCKLYVDLKKIQTGRSFKFFSSFRFEGGQTFMNVGCSRCRPRYVCSRKKCYHSCDTDSVRESRRFWCFVNFGQWPRIFLSLWKEIFDGIGAENLLLTKATLNAAASFNHRSLSKNKA